MVMPRRPSGEASAVLRHAQVDEMLLSAPGFGLFRKHGSEERSLKADEAASLLGEGDRFLNVRISGAVFPILFVGREAREAEHREGNVARPFRWQEVPVVDAAESRQQFQPHPAVSFEFGEFFLVDLVSQVTSDHRLMLRRATNLALIVSLAVSPRSRPNFAKDAYLVT